MNGCLSPWLPCPLWLPNPRINIFTLRLTPSAQNAHDKLLDHYNRVNKGHTALSASSTKR